MPDIPAQAVRAAVAAYTCAWVSGVGRPEELVSVVLEAAAPGIAGQARAEALRDVIAGRVTLDEQAAAQGHTEPQRIEDLSSSLPFSEADLQAYFAAMEDRGPTYEEDLRADERRKVAREIAKEILRQKPAGGTQLTWDGGLRRAARVARQIGEAQ